MIYLLSPETSSILLPSSDKKARGPQAPEVSTATGIEKRNTFEAFWLQQERSQPLLPLLLLEHRRVKHIQFNKISSFNKHFLQVFYYIIV